MKEHAKLVKSDKLHGDVYSHPAYGLISYHHVTGGENVLVGSDLKHNHVVKLTIQTAEVIRNLGRDWFHGRKTIVDIEMSANQWSTFICSPNSSGIPCTIRYAPNGQLEEKARLFPVEKHNLHKEELEKYADETLGSLNRLVKEMEGLTESGTIKKTDFKRLLHDLKCKVGNLAGNMDFQVEQHKNMMDKAVVSAKSDIEAYTTDTIYRLGLDKLKEIAPRMEIREIE